jgi:hypothetical protein
LQLIAVACLVLFSAGGQLFTDVTRTALTYGTFGAYIVIPVFLIAGFVIGEVTPILLVSTVHTYFVLDGPKENEQLAHTFIVSSPTDRRKGVHIPLRN